MFLEHLNNFNDPTFDLFDLEQCILQNFPNLGSVQTFCEEFLKQNKKLQVDQLIEIVLPGAESDAVQVNLSYHIYRSSRSIAFRSFAFWLEKLAPLIFYN